VQNPQVNLCSPAFGIDTVENVVGVIAALASSVFKAAVTDAADRLRGEGNNFQLLDNVADLFVSVGYDDLRMILGPDIWQRLTQTWAARHSYTHEAESSAGSIVRWAPKSDTFPTSME
jgi:hypothetical protein